MRRASTSGATGQGGSYLLATEHYIAGLALLNMGAGFEIAIKKLVEKIAKLAGFQDQICWDTSEEIVRKAFVTKFALAERG